MELLRLIEEFRVAGGGECALATVVETIGPAYRRAGARLLVRRDRRRWGAISGGCVESDLVLHALDVMNRHEAALVRYTTADDDPIFGLGSGCGGEFAVLVEPLTERRILELYDQMMNRSDGDVLITVHRAPESQLLGTRVMPSTEAPSGAFVQRIIPPLSVFIFGVSPAAEPLARIAKQLGWNVKIADFRPIITEDERLAAVADEIVIGPVEELPPRFAYAPPSAAVVMTHQYVRDLELVKQLLPRRLEYLGVVGSRRRAQRLVSDLRAAGVDSDLLASLRAPAGLDLAADEPSEIALSIVAEIQGVVRRASSAALRDRPGAIHDATDESAIAILAAGGSRRMGQPKQLVEIAGKSLIRIAAEAALAAGSASVHIVIGAEADRLRAELRELPVEIVMNEGWQEGIASSIRAAVEAIERREHPVENLLLMLCDQPGVSGDFLRRLLAAHRATRAPVIASRYPDGPGVPALFHASLFPALKALDGDTGARHVIRQLDREVVTIPFEDSADADTLADVARFAGQPV
jgi:xanthine/CO dehydrogenase XdhC/CoxF family maturation factor/CTP:molybdopterin cytidylyltransferase MocA